MGQHKYNPTAIAAAKGELPHKPQKMSKRESERLLYAECQRILYKPLVDAYVKMQDEEYADKVLNNTKLMDKSANI
jgi:hypothetical protein